MRTPEVGVPSNGVINVGDAPNEVRDEVVTPPARVDPDNVPADAVIVIFVVPSNKTPLIVLPVCSAVAVAAFPVVF